MRKLKQKLGMLLLILCVLSSAWSCGGDDKNNPRSPVKSKIQLSTKKEAPLRSFNQPLLTKAEIKQIGQMHNKVLSNILYRLQHKKFSHSHAVALEELLGLINNELDNFYRQNVSSGNEISLARQLSQTFKPYSKNNISDLSPIQTIIKKDSTPFSKAQTKLLSACDEILNSASEIGLALSKDKLNEIQEKAQTKLSADQAQAILIAAEVGKASLSYWHENINAWKKTLKDINPQQNDDGGGWFSWCKCSGADVAGAAGAATALLPEAFVPGGQAAYVGEVACWGAGTSVLSAVGQIWDHYCCGCDTIEKESEDHGKEKNTLDKKTWVNTVCLAIGLSIANMIYSLLQGKYEYHYISFCNIAVLIVKAGVFILIMYLFYRYRIFNYHGNSSALRHKWVAIIPPLFIVCSLLLGHYIYPKLWNYVIIGLIGGVVALLLRSLVFLFEKVLKMNKVP